MKIRAVIWNLYLLLACFATVPRLYAQDNRSPRPNIIVITTDEQSADAMSWVMGKQWIHTPAMDKLAAQGVAFKKAYAANPLCVPSRNSIITGLLPHTTGVESNQDLANGRNAKHRFWTGMNFESMGTYFKQAGYQTTYLGKWHINYSPEDKKAHGFDFVRFTTARGKDDALPEAVDHFLEQPHDQPFLLFVSFLNPHDVCEWARHQHLPNGSIGAIPPLDELPPMRKNALPPKNESDAMTLMRKSYHNNLSLFPVGGYENTDWRRLAWGYYRLVEKVDSLVGQVLDAIAKNGYDDNSLILFTSDHGECLGAHAFNQKTVFYEESARVPFILRYPGLLNPGANYSLVNTGIDILPTLLDFAGIDIPDQLPGRSLKKVAIENRTLHCRPFIVVENKMVQGGNVGDSIPVLNGRMVRSERYKYCLYDIGKQREALFDLKDDPGEAVNLAADTSFSLIVKKHRKYLREFAIKHRDTLAAKMLCHIE